MYNLALILDTIMSGTLTRIKIVETSIKLFNQQGTQNVRLQQIADDVGISVGNLAYHFHDKKKILKSSISLVNKAFSDADKSWKNLSQFIDFDNQLARHYHLLNMYAFYFLDVVDIKRFYPDIYEGHQAQIEGFIKNLTLWLEKGVEKELFIPPKREGQYADVSQMIWFISAFWMSKKRIIEEVEEDFELGFKKMIWQQLEPFLTPKGKTEFDLVIAPALYMT